MKTKFSDLEIKTCVTCGEEDKMLVSDTVSNTFITLKIECVRCKNSFVTNMDGDTWDGAITTWNKLMMDGAKRKEL